MIGGDIGAEVGFGEQHHRSGAARPHHRERTLDAPQLQCGPERDRHEDEVDVRGDRLRCGGDARGTAHEHAASREQVGAEAVLDDEPVTCCDATIGGDAGKRRGKLHTLRTGCGDDGQRAPVDARDQATMAVAGGDVSKRRLEGAAPSERGETAKIVMQIETPWG